MATKYLWTLHIHIEQYTSSLLLLCYGNHVVVVSTQYMMEQYTTNILLLCYGHQVLVDTTLHIVQCTTSITIIVMLWPSCTCGHYTT